MKCCVTGILPNELIFSCVCIIVLCLKILILPVKQKNSFTQIFIIFENDQLEQFYFEKFSADWPELKRRWQNLLARTPKTYWTLLLQKIEVSKSWVKGFAYEYLSSHCLFYAFNICQSFLLVTITIYLSKCTWFDLWCSGIFAFPSIPDLYTLTFAPDRYTGDSQKYIHTIHPIQSKNLQIDLETFFTRVLHPSSLSLNMPIYLTY